MLGMSNLVTFLEHTEEYTRDLRRVEYGDERDPKMRAFLEKIAPMNNVKKIRKPMMVVAGKNDPRVPVSESDQIVAALKRNGTPVWYMVAKDEGHGYQKKANGDFEFYATVAFLGNICSIKWDTMPAFTRPQAPRVACTAGSTQTGGCAAISGGSGPLLVQLPQVARLGHRGSDVTAWLAVMRSLSA
jgi:hypothetical protein